MNIARYLLLIFSLIALAMSGPLVRLATAPAVVVVLWRVVLAWPTLAGVAAKQRSSWPFKSASWGGVFLAAHWLTWVLAVQQTTISSASLLCATGALWAALLSKPILGEKVSLNQWSGLAAALVGVSIVLVAQQGGVHTLRGDLLALVSSLAWTGYAFVGRRARQSSSFFGYTATLYLVTGLIIFLASLMMRAPLWHFDGRTWIAFAALAIFPTLLGHGSFNYLLRFLGPARLGIWSLSEPVIATIIAWIAYGEKPTLQVLIGGGIALLGVALGISGEATQDSQIAPVVVD